jgi:hypothetical protein
MYLGNVTADAGYSSTATVSYNANGASEVPIWSVSGNTSQLSLGCSVSAHLTGQSVY